MSGPEVTCCPPASPTAAHVKRAPASEVILLPVAWRGEAVWLRIVKAVEELLSEERPEDAEVH